MANHRENYSVESIIQALKQRLVHPLPGWNAHSQMATQVHQNARAISREDARVAAVLILLFPQKNQLHFPLILRPTYDGVHSGQMAFPGGKAEPQDQDLTDTALRETEEEIGVKIEKAKVLGQLSALYIPPSNIRVTPVVAFCQDVPSYLLDPSEVADIVNVSVDEIMDEQNRIATKVAVAGGFTMEVPAFKIQNKIVWGATAMMLSELLSIFDEIF